jgi:hypothetical protein
MFMMKVDISPGMFDVEQLKHLIYYEEILLELYLHNYLSRRSSIELYKILEFCNIRKIIQCILILIFSILV